MIVFSHIEKTAGTTFKTVLRSNFGPAHVETNKIKRPVYSAQDLAFARKVFPRIRAISGHNLSDPPRNLGEAGIQMITFLRKPADRCISHYQDKVIRAGEKRSFEEWISQEKYQNFMVRSLTGEQDLDRAKSLLKEDYLFVGFTERFEESLKLLNLMLPEPLELQYRTSVKARSNHVRIQLVKDPRAMELLEKYNALDQELYDFALEEIYLPALELHRDALDLVKVESGFVSRRHIRRHWMGVKYNNVVYRQLIKLLRA